MDHDAVPREIAGQLQRATVLDDLLVSSHRHERSTFRAALKHETSLDCVLTEGHLPDMHVGDRIRRAREAKGWSQGHLGNEVGASQTAVSAWEGGRREPTRDTVAKIAKVLGVEPHELELAVAGVDPEPMVPIIGRVGADNEGTVIHTGGQQGYDTAPIPPGGTMKAAALEVVGDSMRWLAPSGSLVYFELQRTPPTPDMIGYYVIAELDDGRVLLKQLQRGSQPGLWGLQSQVGPTIEDVRIVWAAEPTAIIPTKQAQRIIRRAGERQVA